MLEHHNPGNFGGAHGNPRIPKIGRKSWYWGWGGGRFIPCIFPIWWLTFFKRKRLSFRHAGVWIPGPMIYPSPSRPSPDHFLEVQSPESREYDTRRPNGRRSNPRVETANKKYRAWWRVTLEQTTKSSRAPNKSDNDHDYCYDDDHDYCYDDDHDYCYDDDHGYCYDDDDFDHDDDDFDDGDFMITIVVMMVCDTRSITWGRSVGSKVPRHTVIPDSHNNILPEANGSHLKIGFPKRKVVSLPFFQGLC